MKNQKASVTIGPLICNGLKPLPKFGSDCQSLKSLGQPPGFYVMKNGTDYVIAKCDESGNQVQNQTYNLNAGTVAEILRGQN